MKYLLGGYYGKGNFGDDLMLKMLIEQISLLDTDASFVVLLAKNGSVASFDSVEWRVPVRCVQSCSLLKFIKESLKSDCYIWGGGTALHDRGFCGFYYNIISRILGRKVFWIGIGVDHIGRLRSKIKAALSVASCSWMSVRDQESLDLVRHYFPWFDNVELGSDIVWEFDFNDCDRSGADKFMVLSWSSSLDMFEGGADFLDFGLFAEVLIEFCYRTGITEIRIVDMGDVSDEGANDQLYAELRKRNGSVFSLVRLSNLDVDEKFQIITTSRFVVSARLHPFMVASLCGIPALGYAYASKVRNFINLHGRGAVLDVGPLERRTLLAKLEQAEEECCEARVQKELRVKKNYQFLDYLR